MRRFLLTTLLVLGATSLFAQKELPRRDPAEALRELNERLQEAARASRQEALPEDYRIGPEDLLEIAVFEVPELSRTVRVSASGQISLPLIGVVKAAGLSPAELERSLTERLKATYMKNPQVSVFLREFKSDPVSVVGTVKMPGLYYIQTRKSLIEVLAMAQGLYEGPQRFPGKTILVTRKRRARASEAPKEEAASGAREAASGGSSQASGAQELEVVEVPIKELLYSGDPKWNVPIYPGDVVKVPPAGTVYVAGAVNRPGGFALTDFDNISAVQALAMAGGTTKAASRKNAVIIRRDSSGGRVEQKIDLGRVLKGQDPDTWLGPNDILFVPGSVGKESALRAIEMGIQTTTGILIWRR